MIALFLSLVTAALPLAGCSGSGTKDENGDKTVSAQDAVTNAADESPTEQSEEASASEAEPSEPTASALIKARYADTDLGGYVYRVTAPPPGGHFYQNGDNEIWADELTGEVVNDVFSSGTCRPRTP